MHKFLPVAISSGGHMHKVGTACMSDMGHTSVIVISIYNHHYCIPPDIIKLWPLGLIHSYQTNFAIRGAPRV